MGAPIHDRVPFDGPGRGESGFCGDVGFPAILAEQVLLNLMEEADIARRLVIAEVTAGRAVVHSRS
jgi:hypothetical protein